MTHDSRSGQRLLFSPRIMPFLCLPSLVSSGGLSFLPFLGPGCLDFHSTADKQEQERRVKPPNLTGCTPFLSFYSVSIIYYTPHTPYLPAVVSHRLQPYPPTSLLHSRQKAKNASEKKYHVSICIYPACFPLWQLTIRIWLSYAHVYNYIYLHIYIYSPNEHNPMRYRTCHWKG
jgi:hypothetical protein